MVLPFEQFLQTLLGQSAPTPPTPNRIPAQVPVTNNPPFVPPVSQASQAASQPVANPDRFMWIGDDPLVNPAVLQGQQGDNPTRRDVPVQTLPVQADPGGSQSMGFAAFMAAQAAADAAQGRVPFTPRGGDSRTTPAGDPAGTWVTVTYQYEGMQYYILMPEAYAQNLPEGANLVANGVITNDPEAIQRAVDAGNEDAARNGTARRGTLFQMPAEIQSAFRTENQQAEAEQMTPGGQYQQSWDEAVQAGSDILGFGPDTTPTTQAPVNDQGQTRDDLTNQLGSDQAEFNQLMQNVDRAVRDPNAPRREANTNPDDLPGIFLGDARTITDTSRYTIPPLTTEELRLTDPVKANMLEDAGIFEVPGYMMVVQDADGNLRLRPASETAPEGMTIVTYGGSSPPTPDNEVGNPLEWGQQLLSAAEIPQRVIQAGASTVNEYAPDWLTNNPIGQALIQAGVPAGAYGYPAFMVWQNENPEAARAAREGGYNGFTGERAVWERFQAERNAFERTIDTLMTDPTIFFATGAGGATRRVAEGVESIPGIGRGLSTVIDEVGRILEVPSQLADETVGAAAGVIGTGFRALRGNRAGTAISQTAETVARNANEEVETQLMDVVNQRPVEQSVIPGEPGVNTTTHDFGDGWTLNRTGPQDWQLVDPDGNVVYRGGWDGANAAHATRTGGSSAVPGAQAGQPSVSPTGVVDQVVAPGVTQPSLTTPVEPAVPAPTPPVVQPREGQQLLPTDRPIDDLGQVAPTSPAAQVADATPPPLPTGMRAEAGDLPGTWNVFDESGNPVPELQGATRQQVESFVQSPASVAPTARQPEVEAPPLRAERDFAESRQGKRTQEIVSQWPAHLRPQAATAREAGEGRLGRDFGLRPQDAARALASEFPDRWMKFMRSVDGATKTLGVRDAERQATKFDHIVSERFGKLADGFDLKRAVEVMQEARHYTESVGPAYLKQFGDQAELPRYAWKKWRDAGIEHTYETARQGLDGRKVNLPEMIEGAIFETNEAQRETWVNELAKVFARTDNKGVPVRGRNGYLYPRRLQKEFVGIMERIETQHRKYMDLLDRDAKLGFSNPDRVDINDIDSLSRQINDPANDPRVIAERSQAIAQENQELSRIADIEIPLTGEAGQVEYLRALRGEADGGIPSAQAGEFGQDVYERDLARTAAQDVPELARNQPLALGVRASSAIPATPLFEPGGLARENARIIAQKTVDDLRAIASRAQELSDRGSQPLALPTGQLPGEIALGPPGGAVTLPPTARQQAMDSVRASRQSTPPVVADANAPQRLSQHELQSFYVRNRVVAQSQMETLGRRFADNNETIIDRWNRYTTDELAGLNDVDADVLWQAENRAAERTLKDFAVTQLPEEARERYSDELAKALKKSVDDGNGGTRKMSTLEAQIEALEQVGRKAYSKNRFWRGYDALMSALRETFLYNILTGPRYVTTQAIGNSITAILTGNYEILGDTISPAAIKKAWQAGRNRGRMPESLLSTVRDGYGLGGDRMLTRGSSAVRDQTTSAAGDVMRVRKVPVVGRASGILANQHVRDIAATFDTMPREALWSHFMDNNMAVARGTLRERMLASIPSNVDYADAAAIFDALPQRFGAADIREQFGVFGQKWADRHARDWQEALTKTDRAARNEVRRVFFTGDETNIDRVLKRVLFFHYWMSRATPLYTQAILRNPYYTLQFANMLETMANDDDLSGSRFYRFFQTPMGYNILIRPDAFFQTFASFWEDAGYAPDGENLLGRAMRNSPIMVNPLIGAATNMLGMQGESFLPDPVGANKFIQLAQAGIDYANARFGWGLPPARNPQEDMLNWARSTLTQNLDWVPGINPVPYNDSMAYKENEVRSIVAEIALEQGLSLDDPVVQNAMIDPESAMYQEAMRRYSLQDLMDIGMRILPVTAVLYPRSQLASPKERTQDINAQRQTAESLGVNQTRRGGELFNERDTIAAATDYSRTLQQQQDQYMQLGSPEARGAYGLYNDIRYGSMTHSLTINGATYSADQINGMDDATRETFANTWAEAAGVTQLIEGLREERAAFREANPEYDAFTTWQVQLNDYPGGPVQWWVDVAEGNPNAARWFASLSEQEVMDERSLTSLDAYMAYAGEQRAYWDDAPIATRTEVDPTPYNPIGNEGSGEGESGTGQGRQAGPTQENINRQMQEYEADMAIYEQAAAQFFGQPVNIDAMNPMAREAAEWHLANAGIAKPRMGGYLYDYMQWAATQGGGDTSIATYLAWYDRMNPEATEVPAA